MFKKIVWWVLTALCVASILMFSSQAAKQSDNVSIDIAQKVIEHTNQYKDATQEEQHTQTVNMNVYVRDMAHVIVFTVLGFCACMLLKSYKIRHLFLIALLICVTYAFFDECYQEFFISGRGFELFDIAKDVCGALGGILTGLLISKLFVWLKNKY